MFPFKHRCWLKPEKIIMPNSEHHAIVIGINDYPWVGLPPLKGPVNDAKEFHAWLRDPAGGNLLESNIHCILSSDFPPENAQPTPNQVEVLFEPFIVKGVQGRQGERLYIFAAGHGFGDPYDMNKTALYAANAKKMFPWHIAVTEYAEWLRRHATFDEIILIMDCCRTVLVPHEIREPQYMVSAGNPSADKVRYFYAFAIGRGQEARERHFEADGKNYGIFSRAMLEALRVAKPDEEGRVTGSQLKGHIYNSVKKFAAGDHRVQEPKILLSDNDITFFQRKKAAGLPVQVDLKDYSGTETLVLYNGEFKEIRQEKVSAASLSFELEPGLYKIAVSNTGRQKIFEVPSDERITV